ncbi:hypothetical protein BC834DRAFT_506816 [Gloeopeniophorella convolvens]|nr:hypothetical protein BC834DRAFT_506816 [Gloeopeniophorella convolvens]
MACPIFVLLLRSSCHKTYSPLTGNISMLSTHVQACLLRDKDYVCSLVGAMCLEMAAWALRRLPGFNNISCTDRCHGPPLWERLSIGTFIESQELMILHRRVNVGNSHPIMSASVSAP